MFRKGDNHINSELAASGLWCGPYGPYGMWVTWYIKLVSAPDVLYAVKGTNYFIKLRCGNRRKVI